MNQLLQTVIENALEGKGATVDEALALNESCTTDELCKAADKIRRHWSGDRIDTCSIVNARSGRCPEDCKFCAQSRCHSTGIDEYDRLPTEKIMEAIASNARRGVRRFSLVTSGRKVDPATLRIFCSDYERMSREYPDMYLCASMGLMTRDELRQLRQAGVRRYHCNIETSPKYFAALCTTHTIADKLRTIAMAREEGLEICCGGIIGMGENLRHRLEMAETARDAGACSIPVNVLNPIPGTALADMPLISEEEIIRSAALMRMVAPQCTLRFAGGRKRLSDATVRRMLLGGVNGALVGDMLTTVGNNVDGDRELFGDAGYEW